MPYYKAPNDSIHYLDNEINEKLLPNGSIKIDDDEAQEIISEINTHVPNIVSMRQARLALSRFGLLIMVDQLISQADEESKITWQFAKDVERNNPLVLSIAQALNIEDQLDNLFSLAATL